MSSYFVSPSQPTTWHFDANALCAAVRSAWPRATVSMVQSEPGNHQIEWAVSLEFGALEGSLDRAGNGVHLQGDVRDCAAFAKWLRARVPGEQELSFYDEGYSASVPLTVATTIEQLFAPFLR